MRLKNKLWAVVAPCCLAGLLTLNIYATDAQPTLQPLLPSDTLSTTGRPVPSGTSTGSAFSAGGVMDADAVVMLLNTQTVKVFGQTKQLDTSDATIVPILDPVTQRTLVPARFLGEAFQATVTWNEATKEVTIKTATHTAVITMNRNQMMVNGKSVTLEQPAKIIGGRTYLPLRAIAETILGKKVAYSGGLIYISDSVTTLDTMKSTILTGELSGKGMGGTPVSGAAISGQMPGGRTSSADTSLIETKYLDVAYATVSASQKCDIYLPNTGSGPFPVIIQIHGGAFKSGSKTSGELTPVLSALERGYAVVAVEYRLSSEAKFPAQINDIKDAIRFIRANASKYQLNGDKIATWGGSAGGSLSALAGTSGDVDALQDDSLGYKDVSDKVQAYITSDDPAFFIQHGTADKSIPITQSINFSEKLKSVVGADQVVFQSLEGAGHGTSEFQAAANVELVLDFLDQ